MWDTLFVDIQIPVTDGKLKECMKRSLVENVHGDDYATLKNNFLSEYQEKHSKAVEVYQESEEKAAAAKQWIQAAEASEALTALKEITVDSIEQDFPSTCGEVQEDWHRRTKEAIAYIKQCLKLEEFACEDVLRQIAKKRAVDGNLTSS